MTSPERKIDKNIPVPVKVEQERLPSLESGKNEDYAQNLKIGAEQKHSTKESERS